LAGQIYSYPQELGDKRFPNMVKFNIFAKKITAAKGQRDYGNLSSSDIQSRANENRSKAENYEKITKQASFIAGTVGGYYAGKATSGDDVSKYVEIGKGIVTGTVASMGMALIDENQETVKLKESISLYVPQSVIAAYTANWDETDLGPFAGQIGAASGSAFDIMSTDAMELGGRGAIAAAANVPSAVGIGDFDLGSLFEATSKKIGNPYKEQLFKSMGFRQFSFQYQFSPKNSQEARDVQDIISLFKENMHPDVSEDGMMLIYPSEFSIEFHHRVGPNQSAINTNLPKISTCALKNCKVTYGPDGMLNTFKNSEGMPTETTMELQFVELETLTSKRIREAREEGKGEF
jgi:hypothetical protein